MNGLSFTFPELSISHSHEFAAAMSSATPCGIDIQFSAKNLNHVRERFCSEPENELLEQELNEFSNLSRLTLLWSAKEAAKKMLSPGGIPGFQELQLRRIKQRNKTDMVFSFFRNNTLTPIKTTVSMIDNDYAMAICCADAERHPANDK
jgi:phosphopantetheinyl transferase